MGPLSLRKRQWDVEARSTGAWRTFVAGKMGQVETPAVRWHTLGIPELERLKQEDFKFRSSLGYRVSSRQLGQKSKTV